MDLGKREALEAAGFQVGDAADFLGLDDEERQLVELRVALGREIRRRRKAQKLTQAQVARKLGTSQPRVARLEAASPDVSLDLMFRGLFAVGGRLSDLQGGSGETRRAPGNPTLRRRRATK